MQTVGGNTQRFYPHANHLYSVAALTDSTGAVVERYSYNAYGKQTITSATGAVRPKSAVGFDRGFTGYVADNETGLMYARARIYSPTLGSFASRDPYTKIFGWHYSGFGSDQTRVEDVVNFRNLAGLDYFDAYSLYSALMGQKQWIDPSGMQAGPPGGHTGGGHTGNPPPCAGQGDPATNWGSGGNSSGNCWRYACDKPAKPGEPHSPYPGPFPNGGKDPGGVLTCAQVMAAAKAGGAKDPNADGTCDCNWWKIAVVLDTKGKDTDGDGKPDYNDYHFYRQNKDGSWTHKPGEGPVEPGVNDPDADAKNRGYDTTCGYLCVTK